MSKTSRNPTKVKKCHAIFVCISKTTNIGTKLIAIKTKTEVPMGYNWHKFYENHAINTTYIRIDNWP